MISQQASKRPAEVFLSGQVEDFVFYCEQNVSISIELSCIRKIFVWDPCPEESRTICLIGTAEKWRKYKTRKWVNRSFGAMQRGSRMARGAKEAF